MQCEITSPETSILKDNFVLRYTRFCWYEIAITSCTPEEALAFSFFLQV